MKTLKILNQHDLVRAATLWLAMDLESWIFYEKDGNTYLQVEIKG